MAMKGSACIMHLIGFIMQVVEYRYSTSVLRCDLLCTGCSLCPHALLSQAQSQLYISSSTISQTELGDQAFFDVVL